MKLDPSQPIDVLEVRLGESLEDAVDHGAAKRAVTGIENHELAGGYGALRRLEVDGQVAVRRTPDRAGLIRLAVADLGGEFESLVEAFGFVADPARIRR